MNLKQLALALHERPFRKLTMSDREWVDALCKADGGEGTHVHFLTMLLYQEMYPYDQFRTLSGSLIKRGWMEDGKFFCQYPIGKSADRIKAVQKIIKLYSHQVKKFVFFGLSEETLAELQSIYGQNITEAVNDRDSQEYLLDTQEFLALEGPGYSNLRTKMRRFNRNIPWTYEEINRDNIQECIALCDSWYAEHTDSESALAEQRGTNLLFRHYFDVDYRGGLFRADGKVIAFCVGAKQNDHTFMNILRKADNAYRDATMSLVYEFAKASCSEFSYISDSSDMGIPGLRTFKTLLHPKRMTDFYFVTLDFE